MKFDILLAGVGGQGVLSVSSIIASCALKQGLRVKQSEVHGMAQRGGSVVAHLRISDQPIHSDLIPEGTAEMILGMEPVESLRYLSYLRPGGTVLTSPEPVVNIHDYPALPGILATIRSLRGAVIVDAESLAREAGLPKATNVVVVGAASHFLPLAPETLESYIGDAFAAKGDRVVAANLRAFKSGRSSVACIPS